MWQQWLWWPALSPGRPRHGLHPLQGPSLGGCGAQDNSPSAPAPPHPHATPSPKSPPLLCPAHLFLPLPHPHPTPSPKPPPLSDAAQGGGLAVGLALAAGVRPAPALAGGGGKQSDPALVCSTPPAPSHVTPLPAIGKCGGGPDPCCRRQARLLTPLVTLGPAGPPEAWGPGQLPQTALFTSSFHCSCRLLPAPPSSQVSLPALLLPPHSSCPCSPTALERRTPPRGGAAPT